MDKKDILISLLSSLNYNNVMVDEPLKNHTFTKLGGKADFYVTPSNYIEIIKVVKLCNKYQIPLTLIGNGSNLIIKDGGIRGIVMSLMKLNTIKIRRNYIIAQSGAMLSMCSVEALNSNLTGFEFACGIPGTVGGALYMNAGAYEGEIKDIIDYCYVITSEGNLKRIDKDDLNLSYRSSILQKSKDIVIEATFKLNEGNYDAIKTKMDELRIKRVTKQPLEYPSCGSVFKRPQGHYTGKLITDCDLKGYNIGQAEVSTKHAGFIINKGGATAKEYISLINHIQETVYKKFQVHLEPEVKIIGED